MLGIFIFIAFLAIAELWLIVTVIRLEKKQAKAAGYDQKFRDFQEISRSDNHSETFIGTFTK